MVYTVSDEASISSSIEAPATGDIVYIAETKKYKSYDEEEGWVDYNPDISLSLYDMNKMSMRNVKNMDWRKLRNIIEKWAPEGTYFLLYCKDIDYFTLFKRDEASTEKFHEVLKDCLINIGDLKFCDPVEDGSGLEIWVKIKNTDDIACMYLFNYDEGVVTFK